jgi:hypothetical protein
MSLKKRSAPLRYLSMTSTTPYIPSLIRLHKEGKWPCLDYSSSPEDGVGPVNPDFPTGFVGGFKMPFFGQCADRYFHGISELID